MQVLLEQPDVFVKEGTAFFPGSSLTGNGLLVSDGDVWKRQRRLSNPAFRKAAVDKYAQEMVAATQRMLTGSWAATARTDTAVAKAATNHTVRNDNYGSVRGGLSRQQSMAGGVRDVYADFNELTLNITLAALFGINSSTQGRDSNTSSSHAAFQSASSSSNDSSGLSMGNSTHNGKTDAFGGSSSNPSTSTRATAPGYDSTLAARIVSAVERAFRYFAARGATGFVLPEWLPTTDNVEFAAAVMQLDQLVYGIIADRRSKIATASASAVQTYSSYKQHDDLLQALLLSKDEDGQGEQSHHAQKQITTLYACMYSMLSREPCSNDLCCMCTMQVYSKVVGLWSMFITRSC